MNCDICGEELDWKQDYKFKYAQLFYGYATFKAHLECAMVFNDIEEGKRITYLRNWLKDGSNGLIERTCGDIGNELD